MKPLQESRRVEISPYGLTRGVGLTPHSYTTGIGSLRIIARITWMLLSVSIRVIRGLILCAVARPAVTADPERVGRRFL